jgi:lysophospholipase L1-like esterase
MNICKTILLAASILLCGCNSDGYYIFGDSLTSPGYSWANQMDTHYRQVLAVPGLRLKEFSLPTWIKPTDEITGIILFIGTNDAGSGVPVDEFADRLGAVVDQALSQGLSVACVEIPVWPHLAFTHADFDPYRAAQALLCPSMLYVEVTEEVMVDSPDGLHFGPGGHAIIAQQIESQLEAAP